MSARDAALDGVAAALALSPGAYAVLRVIERALSPALDPVATLETTRSALLDRLVLCAYVTALVTAATVALARRLRDRSSMVVEVCAGLSMALLVAQTAIVP